MTKRQTTTTAATITWKDSGVPVADRFDDPYFSLEDGLAETRHVFIDGNDLANRFRPEFPDCRAGLWHRSEHAGRVHRVARFGIARGGWVHLVRAFPMDAADIDRALQTFPEAHAVAGPFLTAWADGARRFDLDGFTVEVIEGDARETLAAWDGKADAWFLDGFSPAKNPELWGEDLMAQVGIHTAPNGTFATYTAAGFVRRALDAAGFDVERVSGYGRKRHMSRGTLRP